MRNFIFQDRGFLLRSFSHKNALTAATAAGIGLGIKGFTAISDTFNSAANRKLQYKMWKEQLAENQVNRDYQTSERLATQEYNSQEAVLAHQRNLQSQDIQNQFNSREAQKQREQDYFYNSMEQQVARARAAGMNPNLVVGNSSSVGSAAASGSASSSPSAMSTPQSGVGTPSAPSIQPLDMSGFSDLADMVYNSSAQIANVRKVDAEADNQEIVNQFQSLKSFEEIQNLKARTKSEQAKKELDEIGRRWLDATFADRAENVRQDIRLKKWQSSKVREEMYKVASERVYQDMVNRNYPVYFAKQIESMTAEIHRKYQEIAESKERTRNYAAERERLHAAAVLDLAQAYRNGYRAIGGRMDFEQSKRLAEHNLSLMDSEIRKNDRTTFLHGFTGELGVGASYGPFKADAHGKVNATWYEDNDGGPFSSK